VAAARAEPVAVNAWKRLDAANSAFSVLSITVDIDRPRQGAGRARVVSFSALNVIGQLADSQRLPSLPNTDQSTGSRP